MRQLVTRRGWAMLTASIGLLAASIALGAPILGYFALLFLLLLLGGLVTVWFMPARGEVSRTISTDLMTVGEPSLIVVHLHPQGRLMRSAHWRDTLPAAISGTAQGVLPPADARGAHATIQVEYAVVGQRRGVWPLGPLQLRGTDAFGLAQREQRVGEKRTVTVVPGLLPVPQLIALHGGAGGTAHTVASRLGHGADNLSPRPYVPGDSLRRMHWRASARHGDLMVRQEEEEESPDAVVVLDLNPARWPHRSTEVDPLFERAVSMCATVARFLVASGYTVEVHDHTGASLGTLTGREEESDQLLIALATVSPRGESGTGHLDVAASGPVVLVTGRVEADHASLPKRPSSATTILLAADPQPGALDGLRDRGWVADRLQSEQQAGPDA